MYCNSKAKISASALGVVKSNVFYSAYEIFLSLVLRPAIFSKVASDIDVIPSTKRRYRTTDRTPKHPKASIKRV